MGRITDDPRHRIRFGLAACPGDDADDADEDSLANMTVSYWEGVHAAAHRSPSLWLEVIIEDRVVGPEVLHLIADHDCGITDSRELTASSWSFRS